MEKITVADICRLAEINRATFYRHYESQYGVLYEWEDRLLEEAPSQEKEGTETPFRRLFRSLAEKREEWSLLLSSRADPGLSLRLYAFLKETLPPGGRERDRRFFLHGLSGLTLEWMEGGFQETAEQMAECAASYFQDLTGG